MLSRYGHVSRFIDTQKLYFASYKQLPQVQDANTSVMNFHLNAYASGLLL